MAFIITCHICGRICHCGRWSYNHYYQRGRHIQGHSIGGCIWQCVNGSVPVPGGGRRECTVFTGGRQRISGGNYNRFQFSDSQQGYYPFKWSKSFYKVRAVRTYAQSEYQYGKSYILRVNKGKVKYQQYSDTGCGVSGTGIIQCDFGFSKSCWSWNDQAVS